MVYAGNTSTTTFTVEGGYTLVPLSRLGNALAAFIDGLISLSDLRAFFALLSMAAIRDAAEYRGRKTGDGVCYKEEEILTHLGSSGKISPQQSIKRLQKRNLLTFSPGAVKFTDEALPFAASLIDDLAGGRSPKRLIPIPRRVIKFLASCHQPAMVKATTAILIRGLTYKKGAVHLAGSCKSSWVARVVRISLRSAKYARMWLIKMGLISLDTGSTQRKLNRTGAYFVVNPSWEPICTQLMPEAIEERSEHPELSTVEEPLMPLTREEKALAVDKSVVSDQDFAPPIASKCTEFAPPNKDKKPSKEANKDQIPPSTSLVPGVDKKTLATPEKNQKPPLLHAIAAPDLSDFPRCESLYWQAVKQGWIEHGELNALNWISAAVRAKEVARKQGGDPVRIFVSLVRKKLWNYITNEQEDYARQTLAKFREYNPDYFRVMPEARLQSDSVGPPSGNPCEKRGVTQVVKTLAGGFSKAGTSLPSLVA